MHDKDGVPVLVGGPNVGQCNGMFVRQLEVANFNGETSREVSKTLAKLEQSGGSTGSIWQHIVTDKKGNPVGSEIVFTPTTDGFVNCPWQYEKSKWCE